MTLKKVSLFLFIISIIVLTVLMLIPEPPQIQSKFKAIDKIEHFAAFFLLAVLFSFAAAMRFSNKIKIFIVTVTVLVIYGILIEILQQYTGRSPEILDLLADIGGAVAGSLFSLFFL